jgi:diacylglycerol O-acyltransferase
MSGVGLAELLCDLQPDPPPRARGPARPKKPREREPSDFELYLGGLWHSFGTPIRVGRYLGQAASRGFAMLPYARKSSLASSVPKVSFNAEIGPRRSVAWTTVSLSDVRAVKKHFDVKVNDVVLELCSSAVRRYLVAQNELPAEPLVVSVPVSTRAEDDKALGNQVASMMVGWATDIADPIERLMKIQENTAHAKEMTRAVRAREIQAMGDTLDHECDIPPPRSWKSSNWSSSRICRSSAHWPSSAFRAPPFTSMDGSPVASRFRRDLRGPLQTSIRRHL